MGSATEDGFAAASRREEPPAPLDPFAPEHLQDPYAVYRRMLEAPAYFQPRLKLWLFSRHEDCAGILSSPSFSRKVAGAPEAGAPEAMDGAPADRAARTAPLHALAAINSRWFLVLDPPEHTRLRSVVTRAPAPRLQQLRPFIQATADALAERLVRDGELEVMEELAAPLAMAATARLLGTEALDRGLYRRWSLAMARCADPAAPLAVRESADAATVEMFGALRVLVGERRRRRGDDVISAMVAAQEDEGVISGEELAATCLLLLFGSHDTSANLVGHAVLALLEHREQWERLCGDPSLARPAVEELLRFDPPLQMCARMACSEAVVGGVRVRAGEWVGAVLGAANRDPRRFANPDELDIARPDVQHLSLGHGLHRCSGAALARMEAQCALEALARAAPGLHLVPDGWTRRDTAVFRGLSRLRVAR